MIGNRVEIPENERRCRLASSGLIFAFIVTVKNELLLSDRGHYEVARHGKVKFAGCISFHKGEIGMWNNCSGHYKPPGYVAEAIAMETGLPIEKFRERDQLKSIFTRLMEECNKNYSRIAYELGEETFGNKKIARAIHLAI